MDTKFDDVRTGTDWDSSRWSSPNTVLVLCVALILNSVLRGIRTPGGWAATSLLINYDFGFSRRGLLGAIISWFHTPALYTYTFNFWFAVTIFVANISLLLRLLTRVYNIGPSDSKFEALVFSSSFAIVYLAHCIGYSEQVPLLFTLVILQVSNFYRRAALVTALFPACLLIHETALPMFFPVILFRFLADLTGSVPGKRVFIIGALAIIMSILGLTIGTYHLSKPVALDMYHLLQSKADFPLRPDQFVWLMRSARDSLRWSFGFYRNDDAQKLLFDSLIVTVPSAVYLLLCAVRRLRARAYHPLTCWVAIGAGMSPLFLDIIGAGDTARYSSMAITVSFLVFASTTLYFRPDTTERRVNAQSLSLAPTMLVLLNLGSTVWFFDNYIVQSFPYQQHIDDLAQIFLGRAPFPPRPDSSWYDPPSVINDYHGD